jgi:hypothetical protein
MQVSAGRLRAVGSRIASDLKLTRKDHQKQQA